MVYVNIFDVLFYIFFYIGKPQALIGIKVVLAHIIKNFIVTSLNSREDVKISWEITLRPLESLYMRLTPRESLSL